MSDPLTNTNTNSDRYPNNWFEKRFPDVFKKHGPALEMMPKGNINHVSNLNEDFLAETLGHLGNKTSPTVYLTGENRFYQYDSEQGIFLHKSEEQIITEFSTLLHKCADECNVLGIYDTSSLRFKLSKTGALNGVIRKAKGLLHVETNYFDTNTELFIACHNGMLDLTDNKLLPFSPDYRRRNKLAVPYNPEAKCPLFLEKLMAQSLSAEDIAFLKQWTGLALLGKNLSQKIVILTGTAQGGKSTFVNVVVGVIGKNNVNSLRTEHLGEKFETGFYVGKTLLNGTDVPADFLTQKSATALKALTGGDAMTVELKNAREQSEITGHFNVIITCNSRLVIRLEGDADAWRRRLAIIEYRKPKPQHIITSLSDIILKDEGPGVLNWALDGLKELRDNGWRLNLTELQTQTVDNTLLESDSPRIFAKERLIESPDGTLTQDDCFQLYVEFCRQHNWQPIPRPKANPIIEQQIMSLFGIGLRKDILGSNLKEQRGYKGVAVKK